MRIKPMKKWTLKNYTRFVQTASKQQGLTKTETRVLYHRMRNSLGRMVFVSDLKKHKAVADKIAGKIKFSRDERLTEISRYIDMEMEYEEYSGAIDYE